MFFVEVLFCIVVGYSSLGVGVNYCYVDICSCIEINVGLGSVYFNQFFLFFLENEVVFLFILVNFYVIGVVELDEIWDFVVYLFGQWQGSYWEIVGLAGGCYYLNELMGLFLVL